MCWPTWQQACRLPTYSLRVYNLSPNIMKTIILCAMSLMLALAAPTAHAQQKIESAYAAFMRKVKGDPKP